MLLLAPGLAQAAAQTFNTALPVAKGTAVLRQAFQFRSAGGGPGELNQKLDVRAAVSVVGYGASGDLTLFAALPYLRRELALDAPGDDRIRRVGEGFGDVRAFVRYTLLHADAPGRTLRVAPFFGLEAPTGATDRSDALGRLPRPLQPGSGSWDPFAGVVLTYQSLAVEVDGQFAYQANTRDEGFAFGDVARLDAAVQLRLWPRKLGGAVPGFLYGGLEANLIHRDRNRLDSETDSDSGGTRLFVAPGLQFVSRRWVAEAIVQLPVMQDLNAEALETDFIVRAGFRVNF